MIKRIPFLVLILAGMTVLPRVAAGFSDGRKLVEEGIRLLESGDHEGALTKFTNAQIENPHSAELHFNMGMALYRLKRWDEAEKSFGAALDTPDRTLEARAAFHLGNCAVQSGKYKEALSLYDRALKLVPELDDARINREWTVRKVLELARKEKEQKEAQKKERAIIEKLGEIVEKQTLAHAGVRMAQRFLGLEVLPTPLKDLADLLDQSPPEGTKSPFAEPGAEDKALGEFKKAQDEIKELTAALIDEVRTRLEPPASNPASGPVPPPAADGETEALKAALPHLVEALPHLETAQHALDPDKSWPSCSTGQQEALHLLLKALYELEDELTRLIQDQIRLMKETSRQIGDPKADSRPTGQADVLRPEDGSEDPLDRRQARLKTRLENYRRGFEEFLRSKQAEAAEQAKASGQAGSQPPTPVGDDPASEIKRLETALGHLNVADEKMKEALGILAVPELEPSLPPQRAAIEEMIKARKLLQPPSEQEGQDGEQKPDQKPQDKEGDESEDSKNQEKGDPSQQKKDDKNPAGKTGEDKKEPGEEQKISKEQAEKMLERARQLERDRRKEQNDESKKTTDRGGAVHGRDW